MNTDVSSAKKKFDGISELTNNAKAKSLSLLIPLLLIKFYRIVFSSFAPGCCRFYPTCSHYAEEALIKYGLTKGLWLIVKRLCKCHPWGSCGIDFVPSPLKILDGDGDGDEIVRGKK